MRSNTSTSTKLNFPHLKSKFWSLLLKPNNIHSRNFHCQFERIIVSQAQKYKQTGHSINNTIRKPCALPLSWDASCTHICIYKKGMS